MPRQFRTPKPFRAVAFSCALLAASGTARADPPLGDSMAGGKQVEQKQIVLISFDSAREISQWQRSRALAKRTGAHFTYFLSCVYLLSKETRKQYQPPHAAAGKSNIGFAPTKEDIAGRLEQIRLAASEGHEIGSHACGHFDGAAWSKADWLAEFGEARRIFENAYTINGISPEPEDWRAFAATAVVGFRAPYLSTGKGLYQALPEAGFLYDASGISRGPAEPVTIGGIARFSLPLVPEGPKGKPVVAMDYNLYARHSGAKEQLADAAQFEERAYHAFRTAFDAQYKGKRVPLEIGFHFTLMNGGAYWNALERFVGEVCVKADVECASYRDYLSRQPDIDGPQAGG
jgi:peptidoglycan/xylan/chitin deacetylase (PgdA/CDA1 family)